MSTPGERAAAEAADLSRRGDVMPTLNAERLKEIRAMASAEPLNSESPEEYWEALRDLLAHVDALEGNGPMTVRSHVVVRKRDMKVFDADAAERLARLVLNTCDTLTFVNPREPDNWPDGVLPRPRRDVAEVTDEMRAEARRVLGEKP